MNDFYKQFEKLNNNLEKNNQTIAKMSFELSCVRQELKGTLDLNKKLEKQNRESSIFKHNYNKYVIIFTKDNDKVGMTMEYILKTNNIKKKYKNFIALDGLTMHVPKGSVYGFVGKNGAGKTTLIRLICGIQAPTSGDFEIYGVNSKDKNISNARKKMGAVVETPSVFHDLTAYENLKMQYDILGIKDYSSINDLLSLVGLEKTEKKVAKNFSLGMRQRLGIAVALCGNPEFLVLDEPINGLDPEGIVEIRKLIKKLNQERKITILISSHILDELSRVATHYGFIADGKIIKEMSSEEFENYCKKSISIITDKKLDKVLEENNYNYKLISDNQANIYGDIEITPLILALHKKGISVKKINENEENLEHYFFSLLGGKKDE